MPDVASGGIFPVAGARKRPGLQDGCMGEQRPASLGTCMERACWRKSTHKVPVVSEALPKEESVRQP